MLLSSSQKLKSMRWRFYYNYLFEAVKRDENFLIKDSSNKAKVYLKMMNTSC